MPAGVVNPNNLHFPLLMLSLALNIYALSTADWPCGNLFTNCFKTIRLWIVIALLVGGTGLSAFILLIDLFGACQSKWIPGVFCATLKVVVLLISAGLSIVGNLLYTYWNLPHWSYTISVIGSVVLGQVVLIAVLNSRCLRSR